MSLVMRKNFWVILFTDIAILVLCYIGAYLIRFEGNIPQEFKYQLLHTLIPLLGLKIGCFFTFDIYRGMWRYAGIRDLMNIIKGSVSGSLLFIIYFALFHRFQYV